MFPDLTIEAVPTINVITFYTGLFSCFLDQQSGIFFSLHERLFVAFHLCLPAMFTFCRVCKYVL